MAGKRDDYYSVLTDAVNYFVENGFDSIEMLAYWTGRLRRAAEAMSTRTKPLDKILRDTLADTYRRLVDKGGVIERYHPGISRFTLARVKPELRAELDRRILAAANLIRLNREDAVAKTLQRFQGWATSIPNGGTEQAKRADVKANIRKSLTKTSFETRRVVIDQQHKLVASINDIIARDGGAIALIWRSNWRQPGYHFRPDHKDRDGKVYLLRASWARTQGLVKPGEAGVYEDITAVGQEPFCRCFCVYLYSLNALPSDMLTVKGKETLAAAKLRAAA